MVLMSITFISAMALLFFGLYSVFNFLLVRKTPFFIYREAGSVLDPLSRAFTRRCADGNCPPSCLYLSCGCLFAYIPLIPMGALPQFISTDIDLFMVLFLLLAAQGFYIRGIKIFSKELYQSLDRSEVNLLFKVYRSRADHWRHILLVCSEQGDSRQCFQP